MPKHVQSFHENSIHETARIGWVNLQNIYVGHMEPYLMSTVVQSKDLGSIVVPICGTTHKFELPQWYTNNFPISHYHPGMFEFFYWNSL